MKSEENEPTSLRLSKGLAREINLRRIEVPEYRKNEDVLENELEFLQNED